MIDKCIIFHTVLQCKYTYILELFFGAWIWICVFHSFYLFIVKDPFSILYLSKKIQIKLFWFLIIANILWLMFCWFYTESHVGKFNEYRFRIEWQRTFFSFCNYLHNDKSKLTFLFDLEQFSLIGRSNLLWIIMSTRKFGEIRRHNCELGANFINLVLIKERFIRNKES